MPFLPEFDRDYLIIKALRFSELDNGGRKALIIHDWPLPIGKYNFEKSDLLIFLPPGYPDTPPDMFYFSPGILLKPDNRHARATEVYETYNDKPWQRWSRHLDATHWRSGADGIHTYLRRIEEAVKIAA